MRPLRTRVVNGCSAIAQAKNNLCLTSCLDTILRHIDGPIINPDDGSVELPDVAYQYVQSKLRLTPAQAEIFAAIVEKSAGGSASFDSIARTLGCSNLTFLSLQSDIDKLVELRYIRAFNKTSGQAFYIPDEVMSCLVRNETPNANDIRNMSTTCMLRRMNFFFRQMGRDEIDMNTLLIEVFDILRYNEDNHFVMKYIEYGIRDLPICEQLLFLYMAVRRFISHQVEFSWEDFEHYFEDDDDYIIEGIERGELRLINCGIVENVNNDGIVDNTKVCFVEKAINDILGSIGNIGMGISLRNLIGSSAITPKSMYYNDKERSQVDTLSQLLSEENYNSVVSRLKEKGFRSGFCCIFHGPAGTGKTETVYQIAKNTGRDIFLVDVSELKSKWVGDSEKNVRALFNDYKSLVRNSERVPILLFNEADAIFGVRMKVAEGSVDKMNNTIQNIILQEMENLDGILIATSNLTENFDPAFERRFIYKILFEKPGVEARSHIWESLVGEIGKSEADLLAREYDFSGGQIENISRKATVDYVLSGKKPDLESLREHCKCETLSKEAPRRKIGF